MFGKSVWLILLVTATIVDGGVSACISDIDHFPDKATT